jgi:tRNA-splicing ligase RtcB
MAISVLRGQSVPIHLWSPIHDVESGALDQLKRIAALPWVFKHVAVMPDVHLGKGATVGSVIAMKDAVAPAAVGVDIGCGMAALKTNLTANDLPDSLRPLRSAFEAAVPVGFSQHRDATKFAEKLSLWKTFDDLAPEVQDLKSKALKQCGSLGGGNHFIELCLDQSGGVWLMLHSGSRNIGKTLAEIHIAKARKLLHNQSLPDRDLAVFLKGTPEMNAYRHDLFWAQSYAFANREAMLALLKDVLVDFFPAIAFEAPILCHHNYVSEEVHFGEDVLVTRKGAIRAGRGEWGIIPGSMGTRSYIVQGLGNPESFESASHGAGRRMSRTQAKKKLNLRDLEAQTLGVECRKDGGVLDEAPAAYKDIDQVIAHQADLVEVKYQLKQVLCVKG